MDDRTLLALCIWSEAAGETLAGKQAVARVVLNRMRARFLSDGTMAGTVLAKDQFSGFWFDFVDGHYTRVCRTGAEAAVRAAQIFAKASKERIWPICLLVADQALGGKLPYDAAMDRAVNYLNPAVLKGALPAWAAPDKLVCKVGAHQFFCA